MKNTGVRIPKKTSTAEKAMNGVNDLRDLVNGLITAVNRNTQQLSSDVGNNRSLLRSLFTSDYINFKIVFDLLGITPELRAKTKNEYDGLCEFFSLVQLLCDRVGSENIFTCLSRVETCPLRNSEEEQASVIAVEYCVPGESQEVRDGFSLWFEPETGYRLSKTLDLDTCERQSHIQVDPRIFRTLASGEANVGSMFMNGHVTLDGPKDLFYTLSRIDIEPFIEVLDKEKRDREVAAEESAILANKIDSGEEVRATAKDLGIDVDKVHEHPEGAVIFGG